MSRCPHCLAEINFEDYPDHWNNGSSTFSFECECGAEFEVDVDHDVAFRVKKDFHIPRHKREAGG